MGHFPSPKLPILHQSEQGAQEIQPDPDNEEPQNIKNHTRSDHAANRNEP